MARTTPRPPPTTTQTLQPLFRPCPCCGNTMGAAYHNYRTSTTLTEVVRLTLQIRRGLTTNCPQFRRPYRPETDGRLALPKHECGLDVVALVGSLRYGQHRSIPDMYQAWVRRRLAIAPRPGQHLVERYDELLALSRNDTARLSSLTPPQGRGILALDGLQPDVGHAGLWGLRDCLSTEVLLARTLLAATQDDLAGLSRQGQTALSGPIVGVISEGQRAIRRAVQHAWPGVPPQLCHFHSLREAAQLIYAADRHAKKERKKPLRGVRPLERQGEARHDAQRHVIPGYCQAVRSALTDDGRPPLAASGLTLPKRLPAIADS